MVGFDDSHYVDGAANTLRLVLVPVAYMADGSGRVPDTSEATQAEFRDRFMQLYPVSDVEVSVREPIQWANPIQPYGQGWQEMQKFADGLTSIAVSTQDDPGLVFPLMVLCKTTPYKDRGKME